MTWAVGGGTQYGDSSAPVPLTDAEFAAALDRLGPFEAPPLLAVAVSGGPDSLALTLLADRWARARGGAVWALSVDHRLRPESSAELVQLGGWLAARSISHTTLVWTGEKPATGIQAAARAARYRLLAGWCRGRGCLHLLTAHHREDQAETHLIRRRAGSGRAGLAGMPAVRELEGCRLLRPLLDIAKERLLALLAAEKQPFIADPSNHNPAFERTRLRQSFPGATDVTTLAAEVCRLGAARRGHERALEAWLAGAAAVHPAGFATVDPDLLAAAPAATGEAGLAALAATIGGGAYPPRRAGLARLQAALTATPRRGATLGGCRFVPWRGRVLVLRELAHAAASVRLAPGTRLAWDHRFVASLASDAPGPVTVGYLGHAGVAAWHRQAPHPEGRGIPALVHPHLAAAWDELGLLCVPHLGYRRKPTAPSLQLQFRPVRPVSTAGFTVV